MRLHLPVTLRWSDLDAYGHVNNAEMLRLLEEARMQAFWRSEQPENDLPTAVLEAGP
ncbi:MAG: thioesterase family protein, partial [Rhodoglobus sp.]